jgi:8-oxo-dGTP diphosphatase
MPDQPVRYVVGLLFNGSREFVVLIQKNRPEWQKGKLNGPGGHIEGEETPEQAIQREFREECGVDIHAWKYFCTLSTPTAVVHFLAAQREANLKSMTDEKVTWYNLNGMQDLPLIPNMRFLIPMALYALDNPNLGYTALLMENL